jgi:hypothetical protein
MKQMRSCIRTDRETTINNQTLPDTLFKNIPEQKKYKVIRPASPDIARRVGEEAPARARDT